MRNSLAPYIVEFIGPFALTFMGAGAIVLTGGKDLVAIALAHGLAIGLLVAAAGHVSGGVYNPALTVGLMATRKIKVPVGAGYIVAQLLGALAAALLLRGLFPGVQINGADPLAAATPALGGGIGAGGGVVIEIILTFFLMFSVYGTAVDTRGPRGIAPLVIGLTITMDIFAAGGLTGAAMNPSRWFGTAVVAGFFDNWWIYWVGPIVGALLAALLYHHVLLDDQQRAAATAR